MKFLYKKKIVNEKLETLKIKVSTLFNKLKKFEIRESNAAIRGFEIRSYNC